MDKFNFLKIYKNMRPNQWFFVWVGFVGLFFLVCFFWGFIVVGFFLFFGAGGGGGGGGGPPGPHLTLNW
ncbi:hypothetical protein, partial [Enterobacter intestinihominis]